MKSQFSYVLLLLLAIAIVSFDVVGSETTKNHLGQKQPSKDSSTKNQNRLGYVYWRNATKRHVGSVIPWPKKIEFLNGIDYLQIKPSNFHIRLHQLVQSCRVAELARKRYSEYYLFDDDGPEEKDQEPNNGNRKNLGPLFELSVISSQQERFNCESMPHADMDEAYNLTVKANGSDGKPSAVLSARTSWGLIRGLETFSQLIFNVAPHYAIRPVAIEDSPRFKHRGFMLDTARHYIPTQVILELLDAMAFNKLNVFHWHMVDDQSFPFVSSVFPQLSEKGSFRPEMVYEPVVIQMIITYAANLGIRVIPELDTPGHTYALRHIQNLLSECYDSNGPNGDFGPIDPTRASAYKSVNMLLNEFKTVFRDNYFHAGGDEVDFDCWKSNPRINKWMAARNISGNYEELSNYYIRRLYNMIKAHERTMVVWQEVFDMGANLPKDTIIHVWKGINDEPVYMRELASVVNSGYRALLSSCWYLNYIDYGQDWIKFYKCDPGASGIEPEKKHLVLGGEICMWTEFVDDTNVVSRTWPRASAAAERLWSPELVNNEEEFLHRLEQHRCRLLSRNIMAEPVNGPGYC